MAKPHKVYLKFCPHVGVSCNSAQLIGQREQQMIHTRELVVYKITSGRND